MPRPNVFDHYIANGTAIARSALPGGSLSAVLLSPSSNPFGAQTNLRGIYVVDCQNQVFVAELYERFCPPQRY